VAEVDEGKAKRSQCGCEDVEMVMRNKDLQKRPKEIEATERIEDSLGMKR
jgi:hypothetical protein